MRTTILKTAKRIEWANSQRHWVATYDLCCDEAPTGRSFFYLKCYLESWNGSLLMNEDLGTTALPGCDHFKAVAFFNQVTRAYSLVHPEHLADIVRDELLIRRPRGKRCKIVSLLIRRPEKPETGEQGTN